MSQCTPIFKWQTLLKIDQLRKVDKIAENNFVAIKKINGGIKRILSF